MVIKLNKKEREALEFLNFFASELLEGRTVEYCLPIVNQLNRMGINLCFTHHTDVKSLVRGKEVPFYHLITNAPWYIRGKSSKKFLPFQIKELK